MKKQKLDRLVFVLPLAALLFVAGACAEVKATATEGKFHLVYLVSTDKVEVGAKAYVEPLFLTNGDTIEFVYRFCRATTGVKGWDTNLTLVQLDANDAVIVQKYCKGKPQQLDGTNLFLADHFGLNVHLSTVSFESTEIDARFVVPPLFSKQGVATINAKSPAMPASSVQVVSDIALSPSFFWMASDQKLLASIVPQQDRVSDETKSSLIRRAEAYAKESQGTVYTLRFSGGHSLEEGTVIFNGPFLRAKHPAGTKVEVVSPIFIDLNDDGVSDVVFGMRDKKIGDHINKEPLWVGTGIIASGGTKAMFGITTKNEHLGIPYGVLHLKHCIYAVASIGEQSTPYDLLPLPTASARCQYKRTYKFLAGC